MKINWGAGIAVLYVGFVAMILLLVGMSAGQKIDMVTDHYYEEELKFQDKIDQVKRTSELAEPVTWDVAESGLQIHFPKTLADSLITGHILFYCPSDDRNDRKFAIDLVNGGQTLPYTQIPGGRYKIQIDWKVGQLAYWNEGVILIGGLQKK
ncbi:FixH family protein [Dyadobacter sp. MSC1_007]|jgi:hypothetical protein|uniref:FixH family protein n=1 Tax=Dyadobacter sp. MSC1_007 TaxID=2909264 RepID=UPI00202E23B1|nr:FixH family protein [Dyadobacter sp. MSC1_007]